MDKVDKHRFWLGAIMMIAGVIMLFIAMYIEPKGEIHGTVLGAFGEIATIAGALLGMDQYVSFKMRKMLEQRDSVNKEEQ